MLSRACTRFQTHGSVRTEANSISHLWCCSIQTVPCGRRLHKRAVFLSYTITPLSPPSIRVGMSKPVADFWKFSFFGSEQMNTRGTTCAFVKCVSVWVYACAVCTPAINTPHFSLNSNCGDLVDGGARLDTEVVNRLAELVEKVSNQHWSNRLQCFYKRMLRKFHPKVKIHIFSILTLFS